MFLSNARRFHFYVMLISLLSACAVPLGSTSSGATNGTSGLETSPLVTNNGLSVVWSTSSDAAGFYYQGYMFTTAFVSEMVANDGSNTIYRDFCFENNYPCQRANATERNVIGDNPVAIQAFILGLTENATEKVTITAASVSHGELGFDTTNGAMGIFPNTIATDQLVSGATCSLSDPNAVGYAFSPSNPGVITGLYFTDEGTFISGTGYTNAYLTAGEVWYQGIVPTPTSSNSYKFAFSPGQPQSQNFGIGTVNVNQGSSTSPCSVTTSSNSGQVITPCFGPTAAEDPNNTHVILGFCISATKAVSNPNNSVVVTRPALFDSKVRVYHPFLSYQ